MTPHQTPDEDELLLSGEVYLLMKLIADSNYMLTNY